jgi:hypothetical protein
MKTLIELMKEFNDEMRAKRMMAKICLCSPHDKTAWRDYDFHLKRCEELKQEIDKLERNNK